MLIDLNFPIFNSRPLINIHQFLTNPTGSRSSFVGKNKEIRENLNNRYYNILKKNKGKFSYKIFYDNLAHYYWFYFKIPSETFDKLYYDVVLEFIPDKKEYEESTLIEDYSINFFSNSPHMTFTYTYILKENKLTIKSLERAKKYSKMALKKKPNVTNPIRIMGFEKSCYYACKYIEENKLYKKEIINQNLSVFKSTKDLSDFYASIMSQDDKVTEYNIMKQEAKKDKQKKVIANNKKEVDKFNQQVNKKRQSKLTKNKVIKKMTPKTRMSVKKPIGKKNK